MNNANTSPAASERHGYRRSTVASALFALLLALGAGVALTGCEDQGPAEKAGERIDQAVEETGDEIDEAAEEAGDAVEEAADEIEEETDG